MLPEKINQEVRETQKNFITQTFGLISSAFVLVAALAWNEAIKTIIELYFKAGGGVISRIIYAVIVTFIAALVTMKLNRITEKYKEQLSNN